MLLEKSKICNTQIHTENTKKKKRKITWGSRTQVDSTTNVFLSLCRWGPGITKTYRRPRTDIVKTVETFSHTISHPTIGPAGVFQRPCYNNGTGKAGADNNFFWPSQPAPGSKEQPRWGFFCSSHLEVWSKRLVKHTQGIGEEETPKAKLSLT